jgi:hypothetical protein
MNREMSKREKLYGLFRKAYPDGDNEKQLSFSNTISEERLDVYIEIFSGKD